MNLIYSEFKRKFSASMYKNLSIKLGEMTFFADFVNNTRGDLYPVIYKSEDCTEIVQNNCWAIKEGTVKRLFCQFFPYASYELTASLENGEVGFCFRLSSFDATVSVRKEKLVFSCGENIKEADIKSFTEKDEFTMLVTCRPGAFDVYFKSNNKPEFICTFKDESFADSNTHQLFSNAYAFVTASGNSVVKEVLSYIDNGISIADIRPIRYENGETMLEQGKIYLTASVRMQENCFQGVFSWIPGTAEFRMTGALFYDCGDGKWCGDVAASVLYHREKKQWYLWVCAFSHGHILGHSAFDGAPRFGVNVIDVTLMEKAPENSPISLFAGFKNDEDPDFFYEEETKKWLMAICRTNPETKKYSYVFFESDNPFDGYKYIGKGPDGCETGGSFVKINGELFFICGNDFEKKSDYRIYSKSGMREARFNYPDGGFRGWGTVIPIKMGSRTRYFWLTFDRHKSSDFNWSYGNIYAFETDINTRG